MATTVNTAIPGQTGQEVLDIFNGNDEALKVTADGAEAKNTTQDGRLDTLEAPKVYTDLVPQVTAPTFVEGRVYYDDVHHTFASQTDVPGYPIHTGIDTVIRVINKTGGILEAGLAIRNGGIDPTTNEIMAVLAQADNLLTSFVIGFTATAIAPDAEGFIVNQGHVHDLDTALLTQGGTIFLSDTVPGGVVQSPPDIASALGTVLKTDGIDGFLFVKIDNLITYPQVTSFHRGQNTPLYSLTAVAQDIVDYTLTTNIIMSGDGLLGTITPPLPGVYIVTFTGVAGFTSTTTTRTIYFELYNENTSTIIGTYPRNLPRDATQEGISFTAPMDIASGDVIKIRIRSGVDMALTISDCAFMLTSNHLG